MAKSIGDKFVMPVRHDTDPEPKMMRGYRLDEHYIVIELGDGKSIKFSEYNAARVCGMLAMFLNLRFIPAHAKNLLL